MLASERGHPNFATNAEALRDMTRVHGPNVQDPALKILATGWRHA